MIICMNVNTGEQRYLYEHDLPIQNFYLTSTHLLSLASLEKETELIIWDLNQSNGKVVTRINIPLTNANLFISNDNSLLYTWGKDHTG